MVYSSALHSNTPTAKLFSMPEKDSVRPSPKYVRCSMPKIPACFFFLFWLFWPTILCAVEHVSHSSQCVTQIKNKAERAQTDWITEDVMTDEITTFSALLWRIQRQEGHNSKCSVMTEWNYPVYTACNSFNFVNATAVYTNSKKGKLWIRTHLQDERMHMNFTRQMISRLVNDG